MALPKFTLPIFKRWTRTCLSKTIAFKRLHTEEGVYDQSQKHSTVVVSKTWYP